MASLSLKHIFKVYDDSVKAVNDFNMEIEDKEFIVFVGPSGCGKSTTLRMIAGLEEISAGELRIDGKVVNDVEPKDRNIAMVFQNYALYPHMSVYENLAFSLKTAKVPSQEIHKKVLEAAEILGITQYLDRKPKALSGGQRQRVALGRAIVRNPKVFLLDEPLSNLDAKLRAAMRREISLLHERLETTFIYVTHDQVEAMTMGTRIVVMRDGFVQQIDTPINLYKYPNNVFVAGFMGTPQMNFFDAKIIKQGSTVSFLLDLGTEIKVDYATVDKIPLKYMDGDQSVVFGIRPDDVHLSKHTDSDSVKINAIVSVVEMLGDETIIYANLDIDAPDEKKSMITLKADADSVLHRGEIIELSINHNKFHVFDKQSEKSIRKRIPDENIINCSLDNGKLIIEKQSFSLPACLSEKVAKNAELVMPVSALILGKGEAHAKIERIENIDGKFLYSFKLGSYTMFSVENEDKYKLGDTVPYSIDMEKIRVEKCGISPLDLTSTLSGSFRKEKADRKHYNFFIEIASSRIIANSAICEKLFSCKGTKIFTTELEYLIPADALKAVEKSENTLCGKIESLIDYGDIVYSKINIANESLIVAHKGKIGDTVFLKLDIDKISVKDKKLDIIIA